MMIDRVEGWCVKKLIFVVTLPNYEMKGGCAYLDIRSHGRSYALRFACERKENLKGGDRSPGMASRGPDPLTSPRYDWPFPC